MSSRTRSPPLSSPECGIELPTHDGFITWCRRRRIARLEDARLDSSHPPTALRIELLERRGSLAPVLRLNPEQSLAIDTSLVSLRGSVEERLVDERRDLLYA